MRTRPSLRAATLAVGTIVTLTLAGCVFSGDPSPKQRIGEAAQRALDELGLTGGIEVFNTSEGFAATYSLLTCVEVADDLDDSEAAAVLADVLNALGPVTETEDEYVDSVSVRLVPEFADAEDLDSWCRLEDRDLLDITSAGELLSAGRPLSEGSVLGDSVELRVPYGEVTVVADSTTP